MKQYLLGIDIGTSACKIAIFDKMGNVISVANGDYKVYYPHSGWAEQNPEGMVERSLSGSENSA